MYVAGFIFARGGSKGIPRKNLRPLMGKPLIAHSIQQAKASKYVNAVIVSTDDDEIASVARQYGAEVPFMRPPELASDTAPEWLAWQHAIRNTSSIDRPSIDIFVSIPATSPLRDVADIDACIELLANSARTDIVITVRPSERNPYFNMVVFEDQQVRLVNPPTSAIYNRQAAPKVYDITTVAYAARPNFILRANSLFEGTVDAVVIPADRALDIDTQMDFDVAELLMSRNALNVDRT